MKCAYPAQFYPENDGSYSVVFVDFPGCVTQGDDLFDALIEAKDALEFWLDALEDEGKPIPPATSITEAKPDDGWFLTLIPADTDEWRKLNAR